MRDRQAQQVPGRGGPQHQHGARRQAQGAHRRQPARRPVHDHALQQQRRPEHRRQVQQHDGLRRDGFAAAPGHHQRQALPSSAAWPGRRAASATAVASRHAPVGQAGSEQSNRPARQRRPRRWLPSPRLQQHEHQGGQRDEQAQTHRQRLQVAQIGQRRSRRTTRPGWRRRSAAPEPCGCARRRLRTTPEASAVSAAQADQGQQQRRQAAAARGLHQRRHGDRRRSRPQPGAQPGARHVARGHRGRAARASATTAPPARTR